MTLLGGALASVLRVASRSRAQMATKLEEVAVAAQKGSHTGSRLVLLSSSMVLALVLLWGAFSGSGHIAAQTSPQPNPIDNTAEP